MKLGVLTAGVVGAALIAGGPTAVWIVAHNEYGGGGDAKDSHHAVQRHDGDDRQPLHPGFHPRLPQLPMRPPTGELRRRLQELQKYAEWQRCVVAEARKAKGPFDPKKACGEAPALPTPPNFPNPPSIPEKPDGSGGYKNS
jgi:hypothetical protein